VNVDIGKSIIWGRGIVEWKGTLTFLEHPVLNGVSSVEKPQCGKGVTKLYEAVRTIKVCGC
jgi:hypothetical protein